jgi:hypothetical protein
MYNKCWFYIGKGGALQLKGWKFSMHISYGILYEIDIDTI